MLFTLFSKMYKRGTGGSPVFSVFSLHDFMQQRNDKKILLF